MIESPSQIAQRLLSELAERDPFIAAYIGKHSGVTRTIRTLVTDAVQAGIQAAWESWDSEDHPEIYGE